MAEERPTRVFILDDHELIRRGLREAIDAESDLVWAGEALRAGEALTVIEGSDPDIAILDVRLPDGDGVDVCREIRSRHPNIRCLMLSSFGGDEMVFGAILAGASGYVLKDGRVSSLIDSIRRVARGESLLDPDVTSRVFDKIREKPEEDPLDPLTEQERKILDLIAQGLTNREIADTVHLAEQTVKNYVSRILTKLGFERRIQAALYATKLHAGE